ncbi:cobalamin biosynthesis protein [Rhodoferax sp. GW822-FHT02A01]|uniref:cobalamin biosynthesis protein n=1 Tax=Rhodoferax sp. GW822-FHT02A01 TaxID=3141537 RepID=UPI00315D4E73
MSLRREPAATVSLGIGCDRGTSVLTLEQALHGALMQAGLQLSQVVAVSSIDLKADEPGLFGCAALYGWNVHFYAALELAVVQVPNPSETVRKHTGTPSVSEAAALLGAARYLGRTQALDMSALLVEKFKHRGADGRNATVSVAMCDPMYATLQE